MCSTSPKWCPRCKSENLSVAMGQGDNFNYYCQDCSYRFQSQQVFSPPPINIGEHVCIKGVPFVWQVIAVPDENHKNYIVQMVMTAERENMVLYEEDRDG